LTKKKKSAAKRSRSLMQLLSVVIVFSLVGGVALLKSYAASAGSFNITPTNGRPGTSVKLVWSDSVNKDTCYIFGPGFNGKKVALSGNTKTAGLGPGTYRWEFKCTSKKTTTVDITRNVVISEVVKN